MEPGEPSESAKEGKVKSLSEQLVSDPNSLVFASLADMYREEGMIAEALAMCELGLTLHPRHVPGRLVLAKIHRDANHPLDAQAALEKVLSLDPGNAEALALQESLKPKPEVPSETLPLPGTGVEVSLAEVPSAQVVEPVGQGPGLGIVPEAGPLAPPEHPREKEFTVVPWAETATSAEPLPPVPEGLAVLALSDLDRTTAEFVPATGASVEVVITRPTDVKLSRTEVPSESPAPSPAPLTLLEDERKMALTMEGEELPGGERAPDKVIEVPAGVEVLLREEPQMPSAGPEEQPATELPVLPFESSLFAAPAAPVPAVEAEQEAPRKEVPLAGFMKSLSETEFLETAPSSIAPQVAQKPAEAEVLSDEVRAEMEKSLEDLLGLPEVEGAMIVNRDGLVLAEQTRGGINPEEAAALAASIFETTCRSIERMRLGQLDRGIVETSSGRLYLTGMGDATVVLLTRDDTKMGLVLMRMKKVMERVRRVLG